MKKDWSHLIWFLTANLCILSMSLGFFLMDKPTFEQVTLALTGISFGTMMSLILLFVIFYASGFITGAGLMEKQLRPVIMDNDPRLLENGLYDVVNITEMVILGKIRRTYIVKNLATNEEWSVSMDIYRLGFPESSRNNPCRIKVCQGKVSLYNEIEEEDC